MNLQSSHGLCLSVVVVLVVLALSSQSASAVGTHLCGERLMKTIEKTCKCGIRGTEHQLMRRKMKRASDYTGEWHEHSSHSYRPGRVRRVAGPARGQAQHRQGGEPGGHVLHARQVFDGQDSASVRQVRRGEAVNTRDYPVSVICTHPATRNPFSQTDRYRQLITTPRISNRRYGVILVTSHPAAVCNIPHVYYLCR